MMNRAGWNYPSGDLRVSDADRDRAVHELSEAFKAGRLTADEFGERSAEALSARTGSELTGLLADLPLDDVLKAHASAEERAQRARATRIAICASSTAAFVFALSSLAAAFRPGMGPQQRQILRQIMAQQGRHVPPWFPPNPGFDWVGTIVPGTIAALLIVVAICLSVRLRRAKRRPA
ncbi:MAG TPA: DUF1707 domain-containing protein [Streptosporangiaceae bacterium]|nr:DUF1707 domain-containing protein [Streptosporangiaceae bacterium]